MKVLKFVLTDRSSNGDHIQAIHDDLARLIATKGVLPNWSPANGIDLDRRDRVVYTPSKVYSCNIENEKDLTEIKKAVKEASKRIGMPKPIIHEM